MRGKPNIFFNLLLHCWLANHSVIYCSVLHERYLCKLGWGIKYCAWISERTPDKLAYFVLHVKYCCLYIMKFAKKKITIKSLSLQISSEVYLFSHIKGKKHQQAVRENSSIQGRELSDEEVVSFVLFFYILLLNAIQLSNLWKSWKFL